MYDSDELELWNLTDGGVYRAGAQQICNIIGAAHGAPEHAPELRYELNGSESRPVYLNRTDGTGARLKPGHFSIDTIRVEDLEPTNLLRLTLGDGQPHEISFTVDGLDALATTPLSTRLSTKPPAEAVAQVVDGRWQVTPDQAGRLAFSIDSADAGYDRIALFDRPRPGSDYRVTATFTVTNVTFRVHNVGLLFRWHDHTQGDGLSLPTRWSTGLAYFFSRSPGLRLRFGTDVHFEDGRKLGDHVLAERTISQWRRVGGRAISRFTPRGRVLTQIPVGRPVEMTLTVANGRLRLVTTDVERGRSWELEAPDRPELLGEGAVGIIALNCGVRIHEFAMSPLPERRLDPTTATETSDRVTT